MSHLLWTRSQHSLAPLFPEGTSLVFLPTLYAILAFGPLLPKSPLVHLLDLDLLTWRTQATEGKRPSARRYHSCHYEQSLKAVIIMGGQQSGRTLDQCHLLWISNWTWKRLALQQCPISRYQHSFTDLNRNQSKIIFGGCNLPQDLILNDVWLLKLSNLKTKTSISQLLGATCSLLKTSGLSVGRKGHQAQLVGKNLIVIGGTSTSAKEHTEVSLLNIQTLTWSIIESKGSSPPARSLFSIINMANQILIFGGKLQNGKPDNSLWLLSLGTWHWKSLEFDFVPQERFGCGSCKIIKKKQLGLLLTGGSGPRVGNELYIFGERDFQEGEESQESLARQLKMLQAQSVRLDQQLQSLSKFEDSRKSQQVIEGLLLLSKQEQILAHECSNKNLLIQQLLLKLNQYLVVLDKFYTRACKSSSPSSKINYQINQLNDSIQQAKSEHILFSGTMIGKYEKIETMVREVQTKIGLERAELYRLNGRLQGLMQTEIDEW